jgi:hypothetical protein
MQKQVIHFAAIYVGAPVEHSGGADIDGCILDRLFLHVA